VSELGLSDIELYPLTIDCRHTCMHKKRTCFAFLLQNQFHKFMQMQSFQSWTSKTTNCENLVYDELVKRNDVKLWETRSKTDSSWVCIVQR